MTDPVLERLSTYQGYPPEEMVARAKTFYEEIRRRRTVRDFSDKPIPREVIEYAILAAGTAPSGANLQPWHFTVITDPGVKRRIREAAEVEEREFYSGRAPQDWLDALAPLGTDENKPFIETAPALIAIFGQRSSEGPSGRKVKNYYVPESVGIATGFLIGSLHAAGLVTLTHTPSPMGFLNEICHRPETEKPYILLVVGYPAEECQVPVHGGIKKPLDAIASWI